MSSSYVCLLIFFVYTIIKYMKIYEEENKEVEDRECKKLTMVWP